MSHFSGEFLENIKRSITGLYDRDKRLKINPENFWIVEKNMLEKLDYLEYEELTNTVSHSVLVNIPHCIPFQLRAKIFQFLISEQR